MEIRPPNKPNYPAIAELLTRCLGRTWDVETVVSRVMTDQYFDPNLVLIAREKGEILGYLFTVFEGETAWIKLIAVAPQARNQGLGREMLDRAEERLFGEGAREMRLGFGPGPLFYPGVFDEGGKEFFKALGYIESAGGILASIHDEPAARPHIWDKWHAKDIAQAVAPQWWSEIEERLTFKTPRMGISSDGKALCLVDPGIGIGPLFAIDEASAPEAVRLALALADGGRALQDSRPPSWWQQRFKVSDIRACLQFTKDLRGVFHA